MKRKSSLRSSVDESLVSSLAELVRSSNKVAQFFKDGGVVRRWVLFICVLFCLAALNILRRRPMNFLHVVSRWHMLSHCLHKSQFGVSDALKQCR